MEHYRSEEWKSGVDVWGNHFDVGCPLTHDLVNKLTVITGHCDLRSEHLKAGSQSAKRVGLIQEGAEGWRSN